MTDALASPAPVEARRLGGPAVAIAVGGVAVVAAAAFALSQGPAPVGLGDVWGWLTGDVSPAARAVLEGSRLPRLAAGLIAGAALGLAGALFQSATRNPMADPGLLGIGAGAQVALALVAVFGWDLSGSPRGFAALVGASAAAALTFVIASGTGAGAARLVLAGTAVALLASSVAATLQVLNEEATAGLFFWGQGSLAQFGTDRIRTALPIVVVGGVLAGFLVRRLDVLGLGDERATALGAHAGRARLAATSTGVVLTAGAVTATGPIGFVGLLAPHAARRLGARRHGSLLPASALLGAALVLAADGMVRVVGGTLESGELPVGVLTALVGAPFLFVLARHVASGAPPRDVGRLAGGRLPFPAALAVVVAVGVVGLVLLLTLGESVVPVGDVVSSLVGAGDALSRSIVLESRLPRLLVAGAAGAALAVSGCLLQGVTRNPLAAPSTLGLVSGATAGALLLVLVVPSAPVELVPLFAFGGAIVAVALVLGLSGRLDPNRLVLVGIAVAAFGAALVSLMVVGNEVRVAQALTFISGSTYGRSWSDLRLIAPFLLLVPVAWLAGRHADLLAVGDDTATSLGLAVGRARLLLIGIATLLAAAAVSAVGAVAFIGLVAPQVARLLSGPVHRRSIVLSALVGALLLMSADAIGRWVLAPREIPSGLVVALIGAPVFVLLMLATRATAADR